MSVRDFLDLSSAKEVQDALFSNNDIVAGTSQRDILNGFQGDDTLYGGGGDTLYGGLGSDELWGVSGRNELYGGDGKDQLYGGAFADTLVGGEGRDHFLYFKASDSGRKQSERDVITDFERGSDRIDLSEEFNEGRDIDFIGKAAFDGENQIRYVSDGKGVIVFVNLDDDAKAEFSIRLLGVEKLSESDFIL